VNEAKSSFLKYSTVYIFESLQLFTTILHDVLIIHHCTFYGPFIDQLSLFNHSCFSFICFFWFLSLLTFLLLSRFYYLATMLCFCFITFFCACLFSEPTLFSFCNYQFVCSLILAMMLLIFTE